MTRSESDHLRYVARREERLERQREYYRAHREEILAKARLRRLGLWERPPFTEERAEAARERKRERDRAYQRKRRELLKK